MADNLMDNIKGSRIKKFDVRMLTMIAVLLLLWLFFTFFTSNGFSRIGNSFISAQNLSNLMRQTTICGIMGIGMVLVIVSGGIDLSAGAVVGFVGCLAAWMQVYRNMDTTPTIIICFTVSVLIYVAQGSLIAYAGLAPFIVTLGGMLVFKGMVLLLTGGATIAPLRRSLLFFGQDYIKPSASIGIGIIFCALLLFNEFQKRRSKRKHGTLTETARLMFFRWGICVVSVMIAIFIMNNFHGMPVPVLIMFILVMLLTLLTERTTFGRRIYAIGGNLDAARYSGINVRKNVVIVYAIHGLMIGIAGLLLAARLNASTNTAMNMSLELDAIAAAVIGGTSMTGGVGKVSGAIFGALIMTSIDNGMSMMNMEAFWQYIVKGFILVTAVWFDVRTNKAKRR